MTAETHKIKALKIAFGGCSEAGMKPQNEDAFAALMPVKHVSNIKGAVVCIADGVSCSDNASEASQTSVTTFIEDYLSTPDTWDVRTSASRVLSSLNSWLFHRGQVSLTRQNGLVTTFSSVIFKSTSMHVLHIGDSRVYRCRPQELIQLTRDHSLVQNNGSSILTRALGMDNHMQVDYFQKNLRVGDVLMLSTDGVHDMLELDKLQAFLEPLCQDGGVPSIAGQNYKLEQVAKEIVEAASQAGSKDNLSCVLVKILELPYEDINEAHRKLTKLVIPPVLEPGMKLDDFTIEKVIYSGARSHIYLANHPRFKEKFAIKIPSQNFAEDPEYLEGFVRESWVGKRVNNPAIMKIYDYSSESKFLYHICEYVSGQTLRQWMYDNKEPSLNLVRDLVKQIIVGLRAFQRMGMLHRDLKPENIMLTEGGHVKLIDFGTVQVNGLQEISSPLLEKTLVGTVDYIAPEYVIGDSGGGRSDIFSLGVIIFEMLSGYLPYKAIRSSQHKVDSYDRWQYRSLLEGRQDIPLWVDLAIKKACAARPSLRYQSLSELLHDLQKPNRNLLSSHQNAPLMERNPLRFWQVISTILGIIIVVQWLVLAW